VSNFGKPIPAEAVTSLFKPMARDEGHGNESHSVGLGLFIISEIAKAHGGHVAVESNEESGTVFTAHFPA
jgi:signal transduction histidine kinase